MSSNDPLWPRDEERPTRIIGSAPLRPGEADGLVWNSPREFDDDGTRIDYEAVDWGEASRPSIWRRPWAILSTVVAGTTAVVALLVYAVIPQLTRKDSPSPTAFPTSGMSSSASSTLDPAGPPTAETPSVEPSSKPTDISRSVVPSATAKPTPTNSHSKSQPTQTLDPLSSEDWAVENEFGYVDDPTFIGTNSAGRIVLRSHDGKYAGATIRTDQFLTLPSGDNYRYFRTSLKATTPDGAKAALQIVADDGRAVEVFIQRGRAWVGKLENTQVVPSSPASGIPVRSGEEVEVQIAVNADSSWIKVGNRKPMQFEGLGADAGARAQVLLENPGHRAATLELDFPTITDTFALGTAPIAFKPSRDAGVRLT